LRTNEKYKNLKKLISRKEERINAEKKEF